MSLRPGTPPTVEQAEAILRPLIGMDHPLAEPVAVLLDALAGRYAHDDPHEGTRLWQHPDDPGKYVRARNGIITCKDGALCMVRAEELWIRETSKQEPRVEIYFGQCFPDDAKLKPFNYPVIVERLEHEFECKLDGASIRAGMDGFFHLVFQRQFRESDRQRLRAEQAVTWLGEYACHYGASMVVVETGRIEVIFRLPTEKDPK